MVGPSGYRRRPGPAVPSCGVAGSLPGHLRPCDPGADRRRSSRRSVVRLDRARTAYPLHTHLRPLAAPETDDHAAALSSTCRYGALVRGVSQRDEGRSGMGGRFRYVESICRARSRQGAGRRDGGSVGVVRSGQERSTRLANLRLGSAATRTRLPDRPPVAPVLSRLHRTPSCETHPSRSAPVKVSPIPGSTTKAIQPATLSQGKHRRPDEVAVRSAPGWLQQEGWT